LVVIGCYLAPEKFLATKISSIDGNGGNGGGGGGMGYLLAKGCYDIRRVSDERYIANFVCIFQLMIACPFNW
jgi:hypothetical protein